MAQSCVRGDVKNILSPEPLNSCSTLFQWYPVRLVLIFQCTLGLQSQSIDFTNAFAQAYIPSGEPVSAELPSDFKSDEGKCDVFLRLNKILYSQAEAARLW